MPIFIQGLSTSPLGLFGTARSDFTVVWCFPLHLLLTVNGHHQFVNQIGPLLGLLYLPILFSICLQILIAAQWLAHWTLPYRTSRHISFSALFPDLIRGLSVVQFLDRRSKPRPQAIFALQMSLLQGQTVHKSTAWKPRMRHSVLVLKNQVSPQSYIWCQFVFFLRCFWTLLMWFLKVLMFLQ